MADFPTEGTPPFINRRLNLSEWRQYVAGYNFGSLAPSRVVLHHTYIPTEAQWSGLPSMRAIQRYYAGKGWRAGPHIFVGPDGIWLATPMSRIGIHAGVGNGSLAQGWYSLGLEMVGAFDMSRPSGQVWQLSLAVMGELSRRLNLAPRRLVSFHRDYTNEKTCPGRAVSKEWVWASVDAYLNNTAPPPPPPPEPDGIPPADELLLERLLEESYRQKTGGQGFSPAWAFHQYAVANGLGAPMAPSRTINEGGRQYDFQPFARDTLYNEVPNWGDVGTLSQLLGGSIPPTGLGRRLLDETYRTGGTSFRPDWAFHQFALLNRLGPPLGNSTTLSVDGRQYAYQVFAADTLYNLVPNWSEVRQLSRLGPASAPADVRLREALLAATYRAAGQTYRPDWAFHQLARNFALGAPLSGSYQIVIERTNYALQVYALDTLYNVVPRWSEVRRMSFLAANQNMRLLGAAPLPPPEEAQSTPMSPEQPLTLTSSEGPPPEFDRRVVRYTPPAQAHGSREGRSIEQVILHAVAGPAEQVLPSLSTMGARFAPHYYLGLDGTIYQLVDEARAAWHAGVAMADGFWLNLNLISLGIALERPAAWPLGSAGDTTRQIDALRWLLQDLATRYPLSPNALMLWSSLAGSDADAAEGLPLAMLREVLGPGT